MATDRTAEDPVFDVTDPLLVADPDAYFAHIRRHNPSHVAPCMGLTFHPHAAWEGIPVRSVIIRMGMT